MNKIKNRFSYMLKCAFVALTVLLCSLSSFAQQNLLNSKAGKLNPQPASPNTVVYVHLDYDNAGWVNGENRADVTVRFYSDYALTTPVSVTNLNVRFSWSYYDYTTDIYQQVAGANDVTGSGTEIVLEANALIESYYGESFYRTDNLNPPGYYVVVP